MSVFLKRLAALLAAAFAVSYLAACGYMQTKQLEKVFEPSPALQTTPGRMGMPFEELRIPVGSSAQHGELYAWWVPSGKADGPTVMYLHGNFRNIGHNLDHTRRLHEMGYNVLLPDYRGYGKSSDGQPTEERVYEDAEAAWQYLLKVRGVSPQRAFIYGHSLGGAIAIDLAVHHPEAAGLIIEGTFTSMQAMGELKYDYLPVGLLLNQRFESLQKMPKLKIPVLLIHGTWDEKVPVAMAQQLYDAAPQPKQLLLIEGGEHSNSSAIGWVEYRDTVSAFIRQYTH